MASALSFYETQNGATECLLAAVMVRWTLLAHSSILATKPLKVIWLQCCDRAGALPCADIASIQDYLPLGLTIAGDRHVMPENCHHGEASIRSLRKTDLSIS